MSLPSLRQGRTDAAVAAEAVLPPEIAFLAAQGAVREAAQGAVQAVPVAPALLARAAALGRAGGTDAASALLQAGLMHEEAFYRALAAALGAPFLDEPRLDPRLAEARCPDLLEDLREIGAAPLAEGSVAPVVVAPRGRAVARLIAAPERLASLAAVTSPTRLRQAVLARHGCWIAEEAAEALARERPDWSCRTGPRTRAPLLAALVLALCLPFALPAPGWLCLLAALQTAILFMLTLRLASVAVAAPVSVPEPVPAQDAGRGDAALPTYTVLVALHREARVVPRLLQALARLDYPAAKLQILIVIEADDAATAAALAAAPLPARFEVIVAPPGEPRTKPRALNVALPFARGDLLVVYDAEDQPDPRQLREAAGIFGRAPPSVACLQGRLVIDNVDDTWLTRFFAIEYAALFDVLVPALAAWRMPTPLGGTSTHFRTRVLRALHGWDAWNVTEDADLGIRLALAGYQVGDLPSPTFEEAPRTLRPWLRQRTRWMKGFLQTSFTHGRRPLATLARLGPAETLAAATLLPGTVLSALLYPFLMARAGIDLVFGARGAEPGLLASLTEAGALVVFAGGTAAMVLPAALGCLRRGWRDLLPLVPLMPLYFGLVSLAAWLAVLELARHPYRWNKTEHGLSRTSRRDRAAASAPRAARPGMRPVRAACPTPAPCPPAAAPG